MQCGRSECCGAGTAVDLLLCPAAPCSPCSTSLQTATVSTKSRPLGTATWPVQVGLPCHQLPATEVAVPVTQAPCCCCCPWGGCFEASLQIVAPKLAAEGVSMLPEAACTSLLRVSSWISRGPLCGLLQGMTRTMTRRPRAHPRSACWPWLWTCCRRCRISRCPMGAACGYASACMLGQPMPGGCLWFPSESSTWAHSCRAGREVLLGCAAAPAAHGVPHMLHELAWHWLAAALAPVQPAGQGLLPPTCWCAAG